jgi:hypothetical protein
MIKVAPGNTEIQKYSDTENRLIRNTVRAQGRTEGNAHQLQILRAGGEAEETNRSRRYV